MEYFENLKIPGIQIDLYRNDPTLGSVKIGSAITDENGFYSFQWMVDSNMPNGYYDITVKTEFPDEMPLSPGGYLPFTFIYPEYGTIVSLSATTEPPGLFVLPEYQWGALLALISCVLAAALMCLRKITSKPSEGT
jgi:hypothetical protein